jgi:hypothetical protein
MTYPNFPNLQQIYNNQMDLLFASTGLTTECQLNFGITKKDMCPNCLYDPALKKSANKYKTGGPIAFSLGQLCPYCNGLGYYGEETTENIFMAIIADHKKWINPPINLAISDNVVQSMCSRIYLASIKRCKDMTVLYSATNTNPTYTLFTDPTPAGLGDNNYIICLWKNV